jgi:hypothetical protein
VESESERWAARRVQIGERIAAIRTRIGELKEAQHEGGPPVSGSVQLVEAQHYAAVSEAVARRALTASIDAFKRAAEAHERLTRQFEQREAAGGKDQEKHHERAAFHRAAATADRRRAETAQSLLSSRAADSREDT